jgi:Protein of unknown function (DUF2811)
VQFVKAHRPQAFRFQVVFQLSAFESKVVLSQYALKREVTMNATVSILAEIPEDLHDSLKRYLETHPTWDQDRVFAAALSLFLLQNGSSKTPEATQSYRACARVYLESLFQYPA